MKKVFESFNEAYLNEGKNDQIDTEISNLFIKKVGRDANGNTSIWVGFPNDRGTKIQTGGMKMGSIIAGMKTMKQFTALDDKDKQIVYKDVVNYISDFGSADMQKRLKVYEAFDGMNESIEISESQKVKAVCQHCGKKQTATEKDYSLDDVACKFCKKEGSLVAESVNEAFNGKLSGKKIYYTTDNIGKVKYTISYHDGVDTHKDGSPFFGIMTFSNKKKYEQAIKDLESDGYTQGRTEDAVIKESVNEAKDSDYTWYIEMFDEDSDFEGNIVAKYKDFNKEEIEKDFDTFAQKLKDGDELHFMKVDRNKKTVGDDYIFSVENQNGKLKIVVTKGSKTFYKPYKLKINESVNEAKSEAASFVLKGMDADEEPNYADLVKQAVEKFEVDKDKLEKELDKYI